MFSIFHWVCSEPYSSVLTSLWIHLSVSIVSSEAILFHSSSDSLLTSLGGSISASLHIVSLCFPCSVHSSGLSFQQECLLTGLLSNCSIALFIASWNSFMNSIQSALWLTSDELSSSSNSSWSLPWSRDSFYTASCCHTFTVWLVDSPVISCLSVEGCHRTCSCMFSGISSTLLSSVTVPVTSQMLCASGTSPVSFLTVSISTSDAAGSCLLLHLAYNFWLCSCILLYIWSYLLYDIAGTLL